MRAAARTWVQAPRSAPSKQASGSVVAITASRNVGQARTLSGRSPPRAISRAPRPEPM